MCNYYQNDIRKAGREREYYGFDEFSEIPLDIYPDRLAAVITQREDGAKEWRAMRWGFPPPPNVAGRPVTNVRNLESPYWRSWLKPEQRCLVPFTRFSEWTDSMPKKIIWFALPGEPMAMFAGIWRSWEGVRGTKSNPATGAHLLFSFLTCAPNALIKPIRAKAMPVILASEEAQEAWLNAPLSAVPSLAQPLGDEDLEIAA